MLDEWELLQLITRSRTKCGLDSVDKARNQLCYYYHWRDLNDDILELTGNWFDTVSNFSVSNRIPFLKVFSPVNDLISYKLAKVGIKRSNLCRWSDHLHKYWYCIKYILKSKNVKVMSIFNKLDFYFYRTRCLSDMFLCCFYYLLCVIILTVRTYLYSSWHRMHITRSNYSWQMDAIDVRQQSLVRSLARPFERPFTNIVGRSLIWFSWETQSGESCFDCWVISMFLFVGPISSLAQSLSLAAAQG